MAVPSLEGLFLDWWKLVSALFGVVNTKQIHSTISIE